jgi:hypothetical protein
MPPRALEAFSREVDDAIDGALKAAGILLVGGWLSFWAGAFTPPYRWWFAVPVRTFLELVAAHPKTWLFIAAAFALGVLLTLAGLVVLGSVFRPAGARVWSDLGLAAFSLGGALWLASLTFRATATITAARETVVSGVVPAWFEPMRAWSGAMFALYMVLAYFAIAAYGRALLQSHLVPRWLGKFHVVFGLAGAVGFLVRLPFFNPPLLIHLPLGLLGAVLLRARRS